MASLPDRCSTDISSMHRGAHSRSMALSRFSLLPAGEEIAARIYERHKLLTRFFIRLGVTPEVAAADACKIEHDLSDETFQKIKEHAMQGALPEQ